MAALTEKVYIRTAKEVTYLAACAVNGETPDRERIARMNLDNLYTVANGHQLTAVTAMALEKAGVRSAPFTQAKGKAIRKNAALDLDRAALTERLEAEKIWYMPLKGAVLAGYYPEYGMRQMSDNDILIDASRSKDVRKIMISLGFSLEQYGGEMHDEYVKKPVSYFEIHRSLFNHTNGKMYDYYKDVALRLISEESTTARRFSEEDFYVYLIAHEYRHFSESGTGLRSLLDVYVFWRKFGDQLDRDYLEAELEKLDLADFEKQNRELSLRLFSGENLSPQEEERLRYYIISGVYGTVQNKIIKQGRWRYFWSNLFLPYPQMAIQYPVLRKLPFLLPVCWLSRLIRRLVFKPNRILNKLKSLWNYGKQTKGH